MNIVDLCKTEDANMWILFRNAALEASSGGDRNAKNYKTIVDTINEYEAFHLLLTDDSEVVGFSGLYNGYYPNNMARVLNRAYYSKKFRATKLHTNKNNRTIGGQMAKYILPEQVKIGREKFDMLFFSIELTRHVRAIKQIAKWINKYDRNYPEYWEVLPHMYFTCPTEFKSCQKDWRCWQNVAYIKFTDSATFTLPCISGTEWESLYNE